VGSRSRVSENGGTACRGPERGRGMGVWALTRPRYEGIIPA
jgi:hypothetical protein